MTQQEALMEQQTAAPEIAEEDALRADLYDFLAVLLARPPGQELLDKTAALSGDQSDMGRGELLPYASYYLTGFLNEKPLAGLRRDMAARGMTRAQNVYEPEDNIASCMEMMAGLIRGRFGTPATLAEQQAFFNKHIGPWAGHFFSDLEAARNSVLYASVGAVGRAFMEIEAQGFRMSVR
jgi:hypothetical protein